MTCAPHCEHLDCPTLWNFVEPPIPSPVLLWIPCYDCLMFLKSFIPCGLLFCVFYWMPLNFKFFAGKLLRLCMTCLPCSPCLPWGAVSCYPFSNLCSPQMLTSSGFNVIEAIFYLLETGVRVDFSHLPLVLCDPLVFLKWKTQSPWCSDNLMSFWAPSRDPGTGECCCLLHYAGCSVQQDSAP